LIHVKEHTAISWDCEKLSLTAQGLALAEQVRRITVIADILLAYPVVTSMFFIGTALAFVEVRRTAKAEKPSSRWPRRRS
jgi:hypothetical protein